MTGEDSILTQKSNNLKIDTCGIPFISILNMHSCNIGVIKSLLLGYEDDRWLIHANENVLKKIMSFKDNN